MKKVHSSQFTVFSRFAGALALLLSRCEAPLYAVTQTIYLDGTGKVLSPATIIVPSGVTVDLSNATLSLPATVVTTGGSYADPGWLTALAWAKLTGTPTTLAGYGITDAVNLSQLDTGGTGSTVAVRDPSGNIVAATFITNNNTILSDSALAFKSGSLTGTLTIPTLGGNWTWTLPSGSGTLEMTTDVKAVAYGGSGQTTAQAAINAYMAASGALSQGDIFYYNGTNVVRLAAGTSGYALKTNGAGANPSWGSVAVAGLTITSGKTLTVNNTITLAGTDGTTMTFPSTSATIARTDASQTLAGVQTFSGTIYGSSFGTMLYANGTITGSNIFGSSIGAGGFGSALMLWPIGNGSGSISNAGGSGLTCLQLGGGTSTSASYPSMRPSGTTVQFKLGDNSGDCPISASDGTFSNTVRFVDLGSTPATPAGGGILYSSGGHPYAMNTSGVAVLLANHAEDAPPWLYETGPGAGKAADEIHKEVNLIMGTIKWHNATRRQAIDALDFAARVGTPEESSAAWVTFAVRTAANQVRVDVTETIADYVTRTSINPWPAAKQATWPAMTPSQRWADQEADKVGAAQAALAAWQTASNALTAWQQAKAAATASGTDFLTPQPADPGPQPQSYTALAVPAWATP